jgi:penicillin-binding protein 1A
VITAAQRDEAFKKSVQVSQDPANQRAGYFIDWIDDQVRRAIGKEPTEDLVVQTTLDLPLQTAAEGVIRQALIDNKRLNITQDALLSIDGEGRVRAYVGGPDYYDSPFDRISKGRRQPGSSFKPFVYLAAMEAGKTPNMIEVDEPINIDGWSPSNYEPGNEGPMPLQEALAHSVNTIAAKLTQEVGVSRVIDVARRLGITTPIPAVPSIALGTAEVSPLEMAQAYAAFSNGGYKVKAYGVETIRTKAGKVIYDHAKAPPDKVQVIGTPALQYMNQMMRQVVRPGGTGANAPVPGYDIAGKTGTTSDFHDAWFDGFTGGFVTVVWMAGPEGKNMARGVTGGGPPAKAWRAYMTQALPHLQKQDIPGGVIEPPPPPENVGLGDAIGNLLSNLTGGGANPAPSPVTPPPNPTPAPPRPAPGAPPPAGPPVRQPAPASELPY